jgi:predicted extracellular nuclease
MLFDKSKGTSDPVFVVGDLNDELGAVTTQVVRGESPWKGERDKEIKAGVWDVELHSAARAHLRRSEKADFTTHIYNGHHGTLDHIFLSQEFFYRNGGRIGDLDYVQCFNDHVVDDAFYKTPIDYDASDHGQVVARFTLNEELLAAAQKKAAAEEPS